MTTTGNVNITIVDNSTNIVVPAVQVQVVIGCSSTGPATVNGKIPITATRSPSTLQQTYGYGPLPEYSALACLNGATVLAMQAPTATAGSINGLGNAVGGGVAGATSASGLIKIQTTSAHGLITGDVVTIAGVTGTTEANGTWAITVVDTTHFTLNNSVFTNAYVSGGTVTFDGAVWSSTAQSPGTALVYPDSASVPLDDYYVQFTCTKAGIVNGTGGTLSVSGATNATPIVITTSSAHKLTTGAQVTIAGVGGNTNANGTWTITVVSSTTFSLNGSAGNSAYTSGGTVTFVGPFAQFTLSLDANRNTGPSIVLGAVNTYVMPNTGITLDFLPGNFAVGDVVRFSSVGPRPNSAGIASCLSSLAASTYATTGWGSMIILGVWAGSDASTFESGAPGLDQLANGYIYSRAMISARDVAVPQAWGGPGGETEAQWMSSIETDFSAVLAKRVLCAAGYYNTPSAFPTTTFGAPSYRRPLAWSQAVRQVEIPPQRHSGRVSDGSLATIVTNPSTDPLDGFVYHDERINPGLDYREGGVGRFCSATTRIGLPGWFIVNPLLLAQVGSDFYIYPLGAVMDIACDIVHTVGQQYINSDVRTNANGTIYENDARTIESVLYQALNSGMIAVSMISAASVAVDRTNNILTTQTVNITVTITSRGYVLQENVTIGYSNSEAA